MERAIQRTTTTFGAALLVGLAANRAAAQCVDDYLENNDTCGQATLVYGGFSATLTSLYGDDDYFQIHVGAGEDLDVDLTFPHSTGDLDLYLYDAGCVHLLATSVSVTDDESISWNNSSGVGMDMVVRVTMYAPNPDVLCNDYGITFTVSTTIACQDDTEVGNLDNDNCGDANLVFPDAVYLNMGVLDDDPDYYKLTVPAGNTLYVDLTFLHALGDIDMVLYDSSCSTALAWATSVTDDESIVWTNTSGVAMEVKWNVYLLGATCNQYHMVASLDAPNCGPDDALEDNDVCAQAWPLGPGTQTGLVVFDDDPDYFTFHVLPSQTILIDASFQHVLGDIDLRLLDACGGNLIDYSLSITDDEHVEWTNPGGAAVDVVLELYVLGTNTCNVYDLGASTTNGQVGTNYCLSGPNSSGAPAVMSAQGSASVGANDLLLIAAPLPHNQNGLFYYGPSQIQLPFGNGFRCVGGSTFRLPVLNSGPAGSLVFALDYTALPPTGAITPGSSWNFQAWFRDPPAGGAGFDLSDGYHIVFAP